MPGDELVTRHQKMVHGLAHRLKRELSLSGEVDDLIAFGFGGLLEAEDRFDPTRGVRFQTFAYHRVRGAMLDGVRKMAHLPRRAHQRLKGEADTVPTAAPTPLERAVAQMSANLTGACPLQGRYGAESPELQLLQGESVSRLLRALSDLSPRERALVRGRYFEGRSLDAVAAELGISKSWASRLHTQALGRLRTALSAS